MRFFEWEARQARYCCKGTRSASRKERYHLKKRIGISALPLVLVISSCAALGKGDQVTLSDSLSRQALARGKSFGTAVALNALFNEERPELSRRYREILASQFDLIVPESEMKMAALWTAPDSIDFRRADSIADWAAANGLKMKAHVLVWHRSLPSWLVASYGRGDYSKAEVALLVEWYIREVMTHYKNAYPGLVTAWDVVNEAIGPNDPRTSGSFGLRPPGTDYQGAGQDFWRMTLGDDYAERAFRWARAADSSAKLFYNDYHNEYDNRKGQAIFDFVSGMKSRGVPIDGIGLQCHLSLDYLDMAYPDMEFSARSISATVERWVAAGLEVQVSEADIGMGAGDEFRQAALYSDLLALTLLKDGVSAFVTWGFCDLVSWREKERPLYFDRSLNPKQAYYSMLDALKNRNAF
jgi:endo-1,4-beta-xylanase